VRKKWKIVIEKQTKKVEGSEKQEHTERKERQRDRTAVVYLPSLVMNKKLNPT